MIETDEQLMQRYRDGDVTAFDALYRRYRGPVYRYVQRLSHPGADVESLYQDAWLRVIDARDQWRPDRPFRPWLYRIAHNRVMDALRVEGRLPPESDALPEQLPQAGPDPDLLRLLRDCVERLMSLLGGLPEAQRSAFLLKE